MAAVTWNGLDELRAALRALPEHLAGEAQSIVKAAADDAMATMSAAYAGHVVSGNLQRGLKMKELAVGRYGVGYQVRNTSPHAWWYENGTEVRHTSKGVSRGKMFKSRPPGHVMLPTAIRRRALMYRALAAMLEREGFLVSGSADAT
jgi:hypothetical protein